MAPTNYIIALVYEIKIFYTFVGKWNKMSLICLVDKLVY
jgi:hypothetical protein